MPLFRTGSSRIFVGVFEDTADESVLAANAIEYVIGVSAEPPECGRPRSVVCEDGVFSQETLGHGAEVLRKALLNATRVPATDAEPGDSSDEDGGSNEGIRLRVRVRRSEEEKLGVKWHANIFKSSQRLVVDDVVEGSLLDRWNARQPSQRRVRYGDRLVRVNGVRADEPNVTPAKSASKIRAELQSLELRTLFWRPGVETPSLLLDGAVLLCASRDELQKVASVVIAFHAVQSATPALSVDEAMTSLGAVAALATETEVEEVLSILRIHQKVPAQETATEPEAADNVLCAEFEGAGVGGIQELVDVDNKPSSVPKWTYSCRKCGQGLFRDLDVAPHEGAFQSASVKQHKEKGEEVICTSLFVEPMDWMGDVSQPRGKLACGNVRCKQKLGNYSWHGLPCSCGEWLCPAFQIQCARVDCMPANSVHARGPVPQVLFKE